MIITVNQWISSTKLIEKCKSNNAVIPMQNGIIMTKTTQNSGAIYSIQDRYQALT